MANLTITAADVAPVRVDQDGQFTGPAGAAITAGQVVRLDATSAKWVLASAVTGGADIGSIKGVAVNSANAANITITVVRKGLVDLGDALDGLNFDAAVYLSDTEGTLADSAGTVSTVIGRVAPGFGATTPDKLLYVDL